MHPDTIGKPARGWRVAPNVPDYGRARREFSWQAERARLDGLPGGGLNMAHEALDRHVAGGRGARAALRFVDRDGRRRTISYAELAQASSRFAGVLAGLGVARGATVATLLGRHPALHLSVLGTLKAGAVACPLFAAFGPEPIRARLAAARARVLVTTADLYARKVAALRPGLPDLAQVLLIDAGADAPPGTLGLDAALAAAPEPAIAATGAESPALLHFTSGTTGRPKGAVHVHEAVVAHHASARAALDLHPGDVFWCTADPGWVTGISYGVIAPLTVGATLVVDEGEFDAERWYAVLRDERVNVWYTAPTAVRMMMRVGSEVARRYELAALRFIASVGEPLSAEAVRWGMDAFGLPIHDNWWQTETGAIMIANLAAADIRPGSMGRPLPGVEAAIVRRGAADAAVEPQPPGTVGELALRAGWPSMFRTYLDDPQRYAECFRGGWYLSGDLARCDDDGYFWFVGRADDVIKSSGHLIGPFEVECALLRHPAVADAAVIGRPDPVTGEMVVAYVVPRPGVAADAALQRELLAHARALLGPAVAPRAIEFAAELPKTRSGKIMRRVLKARAMGQPAGDTSTLYGA